MRISEYECKLEREAPEIVMPEKVLDDTFLSMSPSEQLIDEC